MRGASGVSGPGGPVSFSSGSVAVESGVAVTIWSTTLAEGEVVGGQLRVTAGSEDSGTTYRSRGWIDFTASRDVGGGAAVTTNDSSEDGTIAGGAISCAADGNDVEIRLTYTVTDTIAYRLRVELDRIAVPQS